MRCVQEWADGGVRAIGVVFRARPRPGAWRSAWSMLGMPLRVAHMDAEATDRYRTLEGALACRPWIAASGAGRTTHDWKTSMRGSMHSLRRFVVSVSIR